jgi:hypothetical protein
MRRWLWIRILGLGLGLSGCASPGQPPTTADLIFPLPYLLKEHRAGTLGKGTPPQVAPDSRP